jgi:hypothetical protein
MMKEREITGSRGTHSTTHSFWREDVDYPHSKLIKLQAFGELHNQIQ